MVFSLFFLLSFLSFCLFLNQVCGYANIQWDPSKPAFDPRIFEDALDPELCEIQLEYLRNNTLLRLEFLEAGARIPRGFLIGNTLDLGNYYQCLGLNHPFQDTEIQGKYCLINGPLNENLIKYLKEESSSLEEYGFSDIVKKVEEKSKASFALESFSGLDVVRIPGTPLEGAQFRVAVCVPKTCTSSRGFQGLLTGMDIDFGLQFREEFCRLPNDKPWVPVDYVTVVLFSMIGLLTVMSTTYDLYNIKIQNKDPKQLSTIYRSFSIYTNTRRLLTFSANPGSLDCVDGIRSLAMGWVVIGHTFTNQPFWQNPIDTYVFSTDWTSLWITSGHLTVDTFFTLSGLLVVYTTAGKLSGIKFLKNIHLFYLNRLLRMFPILATGILLEASIAHKVSDGPYWQAVANQANSCRTMWWTTLLYVQNYASGGTCIGQSWYLAIDMQLHILSPVVLVWIFGSKRLVAWIALAAATLVSLTSATVYNFVNEFPSSTMTPGRGNEFSDYMQYYYINTLTRASPFFVGMIFGYLLHSWRAKKIVISKFLVTILWIFIFALFTTLIYATYPALQFGWDNQVGDSLINSFQRPGWALGLGLLIVTCVHGYGGPINWLLSLKLWKLPARISYAMYIVHWSLMSTINGSRLAPVYFTIGTVILEFLSQYIVSFIVAFVVTVFVDAPFSILFKIILRKGPKKPPAEDKEETKVEVPVNRYASTNGVISEEKQVEDNYENNLASNSEKPVANNVSE